MKKAFTSIKLVFIYIGILWLICFFTGANIPDNLFFGGLFVSVISGFIFSE